MRVKFLLFAVLLCASFAFAQEGSRFFAGAGIGLYNHVPDTERAYQVNFPFHLEANFGYEFYWREDMRPTIAFVLGGGGKDWEIDGYDGGSSRYMYPAISVGLNFPGDGYLFKGFDIFYGIPIQIEKSNIYVDEYGEVVGILGISPFLSFKFFGHYRMILKYQLSLWVIESEYESKYGKSRSFWEESLRLHFQYVF
jgi:hypothetical protein